MDKDGLQVGQLDVDLDHEARLVHGTLVPSDRRTLLSLRLHHKLPRFSLLTDLFMDLLLQVHVYLIVMGGMSSVLGSILLLLYDKLEQVDHGLGLPVEDKPAEPEVDCRLAVVTTLPSYQLVLVHGLQLECH